MSGEKTEKGTPKRRKEARDKGQILKSIEVNSAIILLFTFMGLKVFGPFILNELIALFNDFLSATYLNQTENYAANGQTILINILKHFFFAVGPMFLIAFFTGLIINYVQVGFLFLPSMLGMKFDKINPLQGFKRMFSLRSAVEMIKSIIKLCIIGYVVYAEFMNSFGSMPQYIHVDVLQSGALIWELIMNISWKTGLTLLVLGIIDYAYQWWEYEKNLKMSKQEIKDEYKLMEGDPKVKAKIREVQRQMGMRRMMQEVPKADVVITNPTHFAIALKYDQSLGDAPIVIAKGQDLVALRIKEEAKKHNIQTVENKPLAQALFRMTEIGDAIPEDLYQAVAEILAAVYRMKKSG